MSNKCYSIPNIKIWKRRIKGAPSLLMIGMFQLTKHLCGGGTVPLACPGNKALEFSFSVDQVTGGQAANKIRFAGGSVGIE